MDIRIDKESKIRVYSASDRELCEALAKESKVFVETLKQFRTLSQRVVDNMKNTSTIMEYEKQLAIGIRNAIEIEYDDCKFQKYIRQQKIKQKKDELKRLNVEYESLQQVLAVQKAEMNNVHD